MIDLNKELKDSFSEMTQVFEQSDSYHKIINFKVPPHLSYFIGHFPNNPILPAVGILDLSVYLIHFYFFQSLANLQPTEINQLKVTESITPSQFVTIDLIQDKNTFRVIWKTIDKSIAELHIKF